MIIRTGALLALFAALVVSDAASAQDASAAITSVTVTNVKPDETHILFGFNQILPQFSVVTNDIDRPIIGFGNTVKGPALTIPSLAGSLLKSIDFNQREAVLTVVLNGSQALHVVTKPIAGRALELDITPAPQASKTAATGPGGPLPSHADRPRDEDEFEVVPLKYADVSEVVGLISSGQPIRPNDAFTPEEPAFGSQGFGNGQPNNLVNNNFNNVNQDPAQTTYGQLVDDSIGVDRRLNAIILRGTPERIDRLKRKIEALDVPVPSVQLETIFVELTETGATNLGFDFKNSSGAISSGSYSPSYTGVGFRNIGIANGVAGYSVQAAIYAEVKKGNGRIVSKPRISAQSGGTAKIITGDSLPILTSIALSGVNAVSQQVQYVNVGVTLQIAPRVGNDGYVTSKIFADVSSVTGYSQGYPTISQRKTTTSATVKDGDYFVIGGLTQENHLLTKSKVPGLADIPLAGEIFKLKNDSLTKTELYVVVTPHIVRDGDTRDAEEKAHR
jgi:general secretion pathway protein D